MIASSAVRAIIRLGHPRSLINYTVSQLTTLEDPLWFCLKVHPKREHLVAECLRRQHDVPCLAPRLRFRRATKRGAVWFVEAMFPGYIFARFLYSTQHRALEYASGVHYIVRFGEQVATLPAHVVEALSSRTGDDEIVTIDSAVEVGQSVKIIQGPLHGFEALVTQVLPARERVRVLLDFLGRAVETELVAPRVLPSEKPRIS